MAEGTQVATRQSLVTKFAHKYSIEPEKLMTILKATAFKQGANDPEVTNEQMAALLVVADQYGLNPFTREIFAFADKFKGIIPIVSVDGWARIVNDHEQLDGIEFHVPNETEDAPHSGANGMKRQSFEWVECVIFRKDRSHAIKIKEYFDEVYQAPRGERQTPGPWQSHPKRMHRHKALIQCARLAFGFSGIYDEDEGERILQAQAIEGTATRVPTERSATKRMEEALLPKREATVSENPEAPSTAALELMIDSMENTSDSMTKVFNTIDAHKQPEQKRALMQQWNAKVSALKRKEPEPDPEQAPVQEQREPEGTKERGSPQRLGNIKKTLAEAPDLDSVNDILDLTRSYQWTPEQANQITEAVAAANKRLGKPE